MKLFKHAASALVIVGLLLPFWAHSAPDSNAHQITAVMKKQFDRPDAPLTVNPVTVEGDYAVAGWTQGKKGGRALLQKENGQWRISVCGGDGLTQAKVLESTGMPPTMANKLAAATLAAEAKLSADKRRLFASFEGMLKVGAEPADHGQHNAHGTHGAHDAPAK
jgi:hypothetical protein